MKSKILLGQEDHLEQDPRYFLQNAEKAMKGDISRGLVELITNSDDSYGRIEDKGKRVDGGILIAIERRRKGKCSLIKVHDRAQGMSLDEMVSKLKRVGGLTSGFMETRGRVRGLMGRGSKELVVFGRIHYQSIKDGSYSEIQIYKPNIFKPTDERKATDEDRKKLGIQRGNGTVVTLEVEQKFRIPIHAVLVAKLAKFYSLRDVASSPQRKFFLKDLSGGNNKPSLIQYNYPEGETVLDEEFKVPGYEKAFYHLLIKCAPEKIEMTNDSFQECGILIKSSYAIHEITFFNRELENDSHAEFYFGKLTCPFIDDLVVDYEHRAQNKQPTNEDNPLRIIDPLRSDGLVKEHPFTRAVFQDAAKKFKFIIDREKEKEQQEIRKIENKKTTERLRKLGTEASKFLKLKLGELEEEIPFVPSGVPSGGLAVIPQGAKILKGTEKAFSIIARPVLDKTEKFISISSVSEGISVSTNRVELFERDAETIGNTFSIKGVELVDSAVVNLEWGTVKAQIEVSVISEREQRELLENLAFEKPQYNIKEGFEKTILLLAKFPEFIWKETIAHITSDNPQIVVLGHNPLLKYDPVKKMAVAEVKLLGRKLHARGIVQASVNGVFAQTAIKIVQKEEPGVKIEIKVVDEDLGDQRAVWSVNLLKIAGRYPTIKRYLGKPEEFLGQDTLHFRMLLAELIADNVARKILELESIREKEKYSNFDVSRFYKQHRKYTNEFLSIAHKIQIPEKDLGTSTNT